MMSVPKKVECYRIWLINSRYSFLISGSHPIQWFAKWAVSFVASPRWNFLGQHKHLAEKWPLEFLTGSLIKCAQTLVVSLPNWEESKLFLAFTTDSGLSSEISDLILFIGD